MPNCRARRSDALELITSSVFKKFFNNLRTIMAVFFYNDVQILTYFIRNIIKYIIFMIIFVKLLRYVERLSSEFNLIFIKTVVRLYETYYESIVRNIIQ